MTFKVMYSGHGAEEQQDLTWESPGRCPLPRDPKSDEGIPPGPFLCQDTRTRVPYSLEQGRKAVWHFSARVIEE